MQENQVQKITSFLPTGSYRLIPLAYLYSELSLCILMAKQRTERQFTVRLPSERDLAAPDEQSSGGKSLEHW